MRYNEPYGGVADSPYVNGDPSIGRAGSIPPAEAIEYPQREIANLITDAAITPSNSDLRQLGRAVQSGKLNYGVDSGTANNYATNLAPVPLAYTAGLFVVLKINNENTGAAVLNLNSLGNKNIRHTDMSVLSAGELKVGALVAFYYDGTNFQMVWSSVVAGAPIFLTSPKDFYVNASTGSDSNDGTAAAVGGGHGPFLTLQKAENVISLFNLNGFSVTVHVANGTYTGGLTLSNIAGSGSVNYVGNSATPASCVIAATNRSAVIGNSCGPSHTFNGFAVSAAGSAAGDAIAGFNIQGAGSVVYISNISFGACVGAHMTAQAGALIQVQAGAINITGGSAGNSLLPGAHAHTHLGGEINTSSVTQPTYTVTVAVTFAGAFVWATNLSVIVLTFLGGVVTGAGNVTGQRYNVTTNAVVNTAGGGVNYFPGTIAGAVANGGQYA